MIYTVHLKPNCSREKAQEALARAAADDVALVFPLGAHCELANAADLELLQAQCQTLGKRGVIIGGDELLRAHAVAAGFAAATSIAEWETSSHKAVRPTSKLRGLGRRLTGAPAARPAPQTAPLRVLSSEHEPGASDPNLYDLEGEDPPEYVATLVSRDETLAATRRTDSVPTIPLRRARTTRRLEETLRELAEAEALERAHQVYEERVTAMIRASASAVPIEAADAGAAGQPSDADS